MRRARCRASLAAGHRIEQTGLLQEAAGGLLVVPMAERLPALVAGRIAQAMDAGAGFALVLLDDGGEDEMPPVALTERVAFWCEGVNARNDTEAENLRLSRAKSRT